MMQFGQAHIQQRISDFCQMANPDCVVQFEDCDIGRVKPVLHIRGNSPISVPYAVVPDVLVAMSDDELWKWLGIVTGGKIMRPAIIGLE
jgi:hypothetical protein